jgi:hypothetical protein
MYAVRELSWEEVDIRNRFVEDTTSAKNEQTTSTVPLKPIEIQSDLPF